LELPARDLQQIGWETLSGLRFESGSGHFGFEPLISEGLYQILYGIASSPYHFLIILCGVRGANIDSKTAQGLAIDD